MRLREKATGRGEDGKGHMAESTRNNALSVFAPSRLPVALLLLALSSLTGCVTVKPQERAVLADPIMQFEGDARASAQVNHALENREGSYGGSGVAGGGCGCN